MAGGIARKLRHGGGRVNGIAIPAEIVSADAPDPGEGGVVTMRLSLSLLLLAALALPALAADAPPAFGEKEATRLAAGECVVLDRRPDETASAKDARFVTVARLVQGSRKTIWETIHDKEN